MAMDDIYRLVHGVLIDGQIAIPDRWEGLVATGKWHKADVLDACISADIKTGSYNGYVRFIEEGEQYAKQMTFYSLWMAGWTSVTFMNECTSAQKEESP